MIHLTEIAIKEFGAYFAVNPKTSIRLFMVPGCCTGPSLAMTQDGPNDKDKVFEVEDLSFCIEASLLEQVRSVTIDVNEMGFQVIPEVPLPDDKAGKAH